MPTVTAPVVFRKLRLEVTCNSPVAIYRVILRAINGRKNLMLRGVDESVPGIPYVERITAAVEEIPRFARFA
jgi:hypothetical protein